MAIGNIFPAKTKNMLDSRHLYNNNNNTTNNNNVNNNTMNNTSNTGLLLLGTNPTTGPGNINNNNNVNMALNINPAPAEFLITATTPPDNQGVATPFSGILQNIYSSSSGFVDGGGGIQTGTRRSHPHRTGKVNKKKNSKSITIASGGSSDNSTIISGIDNNSGSVRRIIVGTAGSTEATGIVGDLYDYYNINNEETIHSGHFMLSQVHEDTDYEDDIVVKEENDSRTPEGFDFLNATQETSTSYNFGNGYSHILSIDGSLTKLFECMSLAYSGKIISPKWKPFKGMRLRGKEIVRLNNIIWREWYMQYIQNKKPIVCQFANPLPDDIHKRTEAVVMEGKYWKRRFESVTGEYKSWRKFSKNLLVQARRNSTASKGSYQNDLYDWMYPGKSSNQESADIPFNMEDMKFYDALFSLNQPFPFPNPRELSQTGYAELIQPVLTQLQPNLDDYMDTLEPIQMISDMLCTSRNQGFPPQASPLSSSYPSIPDSLLIAMDNDLAPSLQVRMDSSSPVMSLTNQQLREKERQLGILSPSPSVASTSTLPLPIHTVPTSQQDDSTALSVFSQFPLCSPGTTFAEVLPRAPGTLASETAVSLTQPDATNLLNKILLQSSSTQPLPQTASHGHNQQTQPVQQPQHQQSALSSRVTVGPPTAAVATAPPSQEESYSKDIEIMLLKSIFNAYRDPLTPSKQSGQQPQTVPAPLLAPAHTAEPQLSSAHQRNTTPVTGATGSSLPMLAVAQLARALHQAGPILPQTAGANSLVGLGTPSEGGSNMVVNIDGTTTTIDNSPPSNDSVGNRSSPTGDLFQSGAVSGRKRHSFSKTPSSSRNQGFVIPTSTPMVRNKYRTVTVSPPSIPRTEISSSTPSSSNTFLAQLLTTGKYHGVNPDIKNEPSWKPCIISTMSLATTTAVTSAYPRIQPAQDTTVPTQGTTTNPATLASPSPTSISINFTQPSVLGKASNSSPQLSSFSTSVLPTAVSCPTFSRNQPSQDVPSGFSHGKHANPCSPPDPSSTPNSPTFSLDSPLSSGQEMDTSFPSSQQKESCPKGKQGRVHGREHRRVSHISAEQKRRCNIKPKSGFDVLHNLIPSLNQTPSGKVSKAAMLQKAAEFCKKMKAERLKMQNESEVLKLEIDSLNSDITYCQSQLPATGAPVTRQRVDQMNSMYDDYVRTRTSENWKFYIFSFIIHPLFKSFNNMVSTASMEEMCRTVMNWFDQYCSLVTLRPTVSNALREVCTSTTILTEPERLPEQAATAAGFRRRRHSISGEIDIS